MKATISQTVFVIGSAIKKVLVLASLFSLFTACTNKAIYHSIQHNAQLKCQNTPHQEHQACMDLHSQSYESYKRSRDHLMQGES